MASEKSNYTLVFLAPPDAVEACKAAIFAAGAGRAGNYSECCSSNIVKGQFRPGEGANPYVGKIGVLEHTEEVRVAVLCIGKAVTRAAVAALKRYINANSCVIRIECMIANSLETVLILTKHPAITCLK